jgi:hypothetical protein
MQDQNLGTSKEKKMLQRNFEGILMVMKIYKISCLNEVVNCNFYDLENLLNIC